MSETGEAAPHKGRRVLKRVEPQQTIDRLFIEVRKLQEQIQTHLDHLVEADRQACGGSLPPQVIRSLRLAPFDRRPCLCEWLKQQHEDLTPQGDENDRA